MSLLNHQFVKGTAMSINRKDFLKTACLSGVCLCGFSAIARSANSIKPSAPSVSTPDDNQILIQDWVSMLISNLGAGLDQEAVRTVIRKSAIVHYNNLKMDDVLAGYIGNLDKFIGFLHEKWDWQIDYNKATKTLIASENKTYCVCPIIKHKKEQDTSAICYCSEGFTEKMFSIVAGVATTATVVSSIRRGDAFCKYKIVFA